MTEPPKRPHGIGWYTAWGVLAPVLYVLSVGPVDACVTRGWISFDTATKIYRPLVVFLRILPSAVRESLEAYEGYWLDLFAP